VGASRRDGKQSRDRVRITGRDYINVALWPRVGLPTRLAQQLDDVEEQVHEWPTSFDGISAPAFRPNGSGASLVVLPRFAWSPRDSFRSRNQVRRTPHGRAFSIRALVSRRAARTRWAPSRACRPPAG
jgi:hypothetical protein